MWKARTKSLGRLFGIQSEKLDRVGKKARGHKQTHRCQDDKDVKVDKGSQFDQGGECTPKNCAQDNTKKVEHSRSRNPVLRDFEPLKLIGGGSYGNIFLVRKKCGADENKLYAMKIVDIINFLSQDKIKFLDTEWFISKIVCHSPFLARIYYSFYTESKFCFIQDYFPGGDLSVYLEDMKKLPEREARYFLAEIIMGIQHLHELRIIHRDIKPANILLSSDGHVVITDFGVSKDLLSKGKNELNYTLCGTAFYVAPEIINKKGHGMEVDWWSFGVTAYEMLAGLRPFTISDVEDERELIRKILKDDPVFPESFSTNAVDLIRKLLKKKPSKRLGERKGGVEDIKRHPFFKGIKWKDIGKKATEMPFHPRPVAGDSNLIQKAFDIETLVHSKYEVCTYKPCTELNGK
ncbi:ribosomal protein S6 kinase alpha-5-like isoform X2 [Zootermopsis nevadensis]|uniref:ribosomal protein S6 kinase alpha-5-like isoform X2 n=1 Tax=Zootermopsis nevadensis TaxID=136037 RepID=UPI000B8ECE42|nr:ribosomal protein S6 kinase alpha-5-like isoform X2 [Zootermopsis nevadensis]